MYRVDNGYCIGDITFGDRVEQGIDGFVACQPQNITDSLCIQYAVVAVGAGFKKRKRIAECAVRKVRYKLRRFFFDPYAFCGGNIHKPVEYRGFVYAGEIEAHAARYYRCGKLAELCRRKNKNHIFRRLFQCFEQRVEGAVGEHMDFIHDVYALFENRRGVYDLLAKIANVFDLVVACRIDLQNVRGTAVVYASAGKTFVAGVAVLRVFAVDGLCKYFCRRGFAGAARTAKQICVRYTPLRTLLFEHGGDMLLTAHFVEGARPPFAV